MPKQKKAKKSKRSSGEEIYSVEKILSKRIVDGKVHYFLKWFGYPESENTWEPEENLNCPVLISEFEKQYASRAAGSDSEDKEPQKRASDTEKPAAAPKNPDSTTPSEKKSAKKKLKLMTASSNANGSSPASAPPPTTDGTDSEIPPLSGFAKGWEAEEILGATEENGQILFLIKWFVRLCQH